MAIYLLEFSDRWAFEVTLERIDSPGKAPRKPALLESRGEAPEQYPSWEEEW